MRESVHWHERLTSERLASASRGSRPTLQCSHCTYCSMNLKMLAWTCRQCPVQGDCKVLFREGDAILRRSVAMFHVAVKICGETLAQISNQGDNLLLVHRTRHVRLQQIDILQNPSQRNNISCPKIKRAAQYFKWTFSILSLSLSMSILALALSSCPRNVTISGSKNQGNIKRAANYYHQGKKEPASANIEH